MTIEQTLHRFSPPAAAFVRGLYAEHWDESAWLWERREGLREAGPLISTRQWAQSEARTEAHVHALFRGGTWVLEDAVARSTEATPGELHTLVRLGCRHGQRPIVERVLSEFEGESEKRSWAIREALLWDLPVAWHPWIKDRFEHGHLGEWAIETLAFVAGRRRFSLGRSLFERVKTSTNPTLVDALGRLWEPGAAELVWPYAQGEGSHALKRAVSLCVLRNDPLAARRLLQWAVETGQSWAATGFAMSVGTSGFSPLRRLSERIPHATEPWWALGMLGHTGAIPHLMTALSDDGARVAAADALYLLTGADLFEAFEEPDPDEPALIHVGKRLNTSPDAWDAWLRDRKAAFGEAGVRVRFGQPFDPRRTLQELRTTAVRSELRDHLVEELEVRYRVPIDVDARSRVNDRERGLQAVERMVLAQPKVPAGHWTLLGQPVG